MRNNDDNPRVVNSSDLPLAGNSVGREFGGAKLRHKLGAHSMLAGLIRQNMKLKNFERYLSGYEGRDVQPHSGAGAAQFVLGQADIRRGVPCLIKHDNIVQFLSSLANGD